MQGILRRLALHSELVSKVVEMFPLRVHRQRDQRVRVRALGIIGTQKAARTKNSGCTRGRPPPSGLRIFHCIDELAADRLGLGRIHEDRDPRDWLTYTASSCTACTAKKNMQACRATPSSRSRTCPHGAAQELVEVAVHGSIDMGLDDDAQGSLNVAASWALWCVSLVPRRLSLADPPWADSP